MKHKAIWIILAIAGAITWAAPASADPPYRQHLHIGGGYQETVPGDGGIDLESDGDILTDGSLLVGAATTSKTSINIPHGTAPSSPDNGDMWTTTGGLFVRINGATMTSVTPTTEAALETTLTDVTDVLTNNDTDFAPTADLTFTPGGTDIIFVGRVSVGGAASSYALHVDATADNTQSGLRVARNGSTAQYVEIGTFTEGVINNAGSSKDFILRNSSTTAGDMLFQTQGANTRLTIGYTNGDVTAAADLAVDGGDFTVGTAAAGNIGTTTNGNQIQLLTATTARLDGAWDIGDGTNDLVIATDGFTTLAGTARAVMEMKFDALQLLGPGPGSPPAGPLLTGHTFTLNFDPAADEEVFLTMELAHNWDVGTDIKVNFHWAPIDNGAGTVTWGVETKIITPESDLITEASAATQIVTDDTQTTEDELLESDMITIDLSGASIGDFVAMRIFRDADASEGDADDDYASEAQLVGFHVEYIVDSFGTDEVW